RGFAPAQPALSPASCRLVLAVTLRPALRIAPLLPACKFFVSFFKFGLVCAEVSSQNLQP
ncbi:hypothetical protein, partial [Pantoea sp. UBA6567]|uniref:hypothetical protein n=1 Tax=Pantoea sp. UBA6567 TaxID=1947043 RepID=UPI0025913713